MCNIAYMRLEEQKLDYSIGLNGPAVMDWRKRLGINRQIFAEVVNCSLRKMATYEKAELLPENVKRPVVEGLQLLTALKDLAGGDAVLQDWLTLENTAFDGETPLAVIKNGRVDIIWEMVYQIRFGVFA